MTERASAKELISMIDTIQRKLREMVNELQVYKTVPRQVTDESVYNYMFDLQESGEVNMLGSVPYIKHTFGCNEDIASNYLVNYIENYDELYKMYRAPVPEIQPLEVTIPLPQDVVPLAVEPVAEPLAVEPLAEPLAVEPLAEPLAVEPLAEPLAVEPVVEAVQKKRRAKRYDEMTEEEQAAAKAKRQANKANKAVTTVPVAPPPAPVPEPPKVKRVIKIKK
jgi:hypothetical protein